MSKFTVADTISAFLVDLEKLYVRCAGAAGRDGPLNFFLHTEERLRQALRALPAEQQEQAETHLLAMLARLGLVEWSPSIKELTASAKRNSDVAPSPVGADAVRMSARLAPRTGLAPARLKSRP